MPEQAVLSALASKETQSVAPDPFILEEYIKAQEDDDFSGERPLLVGKSQSDLRYDLYRILVQKSKLDGAVQQPVPERLRHRLLQLAHYPVLAGHPGRTCM